MHDVAALFVDPRGCYAGCEGVDLWDEKRDARLYLGPHPVVAHPPCTRWCRLAGLVESRWGHKRGEDGGCFESALASVRRWGGVLEHPAYSDAWVAFGLPEPYRGGGWTKGLCGGWTCHVEQGRYGHRARKATWLYAYGSKPAALLWGITKEPWPARWHHSKRDAKRVENLDSVPIIGKKEASATPHKFRDVLLGIARAARQTIGETR